jgi:hypothetical protein
VNLVTTPYACTVLPNGADVPPDQRTAILGTFDEIMDELWHKDPLLFRNQEKRLFADDHGFVIVSLDARAVGFLLYRRLTVGGEHVLYRSATHVRRAHHGRGLNRLMSERLLSLEYGEGTDGPVYIAWRTRNPIVWDWNRRLCSRVVPDLVTGDNDPALVPRCVRAAGVLFPHLTVELPSMIMRGAYPLLSVREPQHHRDRRLDALFFENTSLANSDDAIFSFGRALAPHERLALSPRPG